MKKLKGLVLLLVAGIAVSGCYMTPDMGDVELSLELPKTLLEKNPPGSIMRIELLQMQVEPEKKEIVVDDWELPVPSYNADLDKKSSGVLALKVPIGLSYKIYLEIGTYDGIGIWTPDTTGTSGLFDVYPYTGNVKVEVTLSSP